MEIVNHDKEYDHYTKSYSASVWNWTVIAVIFILAFCLRLYHINAPPLDFEPDREYQSYILARYYFLEQSNSVPKWRIDLWKENFQFVSIREPPILEHVTTWAYKIRGRETFWIPKLFSVIFWMIGGIVLLNIVRSLINVEAAIIACSYYLLNPFAIPASRAFMPDPLMILLMILSIACFVKHFSSKSSTSFASSIIFVSLSGIIKPFCLIPLVAAFICLSFNSPDNNWKKAMQSSGLFVVLVFILTTPYYLTGLLSKNGFLQGQLTRSFIPRLWLEPYYWGGWFDLIRNSTGYLPFILGLSGLIFAGKGMLRSLLIGLWAGYLFFGLLFTYHIHTHDYYHLMLTPIIALSLAPIGSILVKTLKIHLNQSFNRMLLAGVILFACAASIHEARARWKKVVDYIESEVSTAVEIGESLNHSSNVVSLASYYAKPLKYHGEIGVECWPYRYDYLAMKKFAIKDKGPSVRLQQIKTKYSPDYFVVADMNEFNHQKELKALLFNNYPIFKETERYIIFSLKK